ncbi:MAG: gamma carbonic anhydrase family protein [Flavobacteriaceae bacterium]|nr:MAG: gamma carbonic anhydrase family protein [Flavobacteriaceae bacterium]
MAIIKRTNGCLPKIDDSCFLAENAAIIGDVVMGKDCSVWFGAVIRGDVNSIRIGDLVNIQDNATIHATYKQTKTVIGNKVSIGHNAVVHGCTIHDNVLVGMGALVMDNCVIESNSLIAAGAVLTQGTHVGENELWAGVPAKKIGPLPKSLNKERIEEIAQNYKLYASFYNQE